MYFPSDALSPFFSFNDHIEIFKMAAKMVAKYILFFVFAISIVLKLIFALYLAVKI